VSETRLDRHERRRAAVTGQHRLLARLRVWCTLL
jgi:hypothetical protein